METLSFIADDIQNEVGLNSHNFLGKFIHGIPNSPLFGAPINVDDCADHLQFTRGSGAELLNYRGDRLIVLTQKILSAVF